MLALHTSASWEKEATADEAVLEELKNPGPGLIHRFGLTDWKMWIPVSVATGAMLTSAGIYHVDAETLVVLCTTLFGCAVVDQVGPTMGKGLDESRSAAFEVVKMRDYEDAEAVASAEETFAAREGASASVSAMLESVVASLEQASRNAAQEHAHDVRNAAVAALEQQVAAERRALVLKKREVISTGLAAVRQYLQDNKLVASSNAVATARMATNEMKANLDVLPKDAGVLVDPVHLAFYSYLHHRLEETNKDLTPEAAELDVPLLKALMATTEKAVADSLPAGASVSLKPLPRIAVGEALDSTESALAAVAKVNDGVFAEKQSAAPDFDMNAVDWTNPYTPAGTKEVTIMVDDAGDRTLEMFVEDEE